MGRILVTQSHRPEVAIPDPNDKCEPGYSELLFLQHTGYWAQCK